LQLLKPWSIIAKKFTWLLYEAFTCNNFATVFSFTHMLEIDKDSDYYYYYYGNI